MLRTSPKAGRSGQADAQLFLHAPQQVFQVFQAAQGFQASGQALLFLAGQEEDATVRAGRLQALAFADAGARAGRAGGGAGSAHGNIIARTGVPRRYAPSPSRARFSASAAPCPAARPLRMA